MITHNGRLVKGWDWQKIAIIQMLIALNVFLWVNLGKQLYDTARLNKYFPVFEEHLDTWHEETATTFPTANPDLSRSSHLPSMADVREVQEDVTHLILNLDALPMLSYDVKTAAADFRLRLSDIVREIDRYDGTAEAFTRVVHASDKAVVAGDAYNQEIESW